MRKYLPRQPWQILVLICTVFVLADCNRPASDSALPPTNPQRLFQVQGQVQQGPDAGLTLNGDLRITLDAAGRLQGMLIRESGSPITVTGQIDGQAIHLAFDLGNNAAVLSVGTLQHDINNAQGTAGGLLTGPQPGDSGDWFARWTTIGTPPESAPKPISDVSPLATLLTYLALFLAMIIGLAVYTIYKISGSVANMPATFSRFVRGATSQTRRSPSPFPRKSTIPSVSASAQTVEPERWPEEIALPLAQFATTYAHGDDHYDLSFTIESARGEFLGECGVGITSVAGKGLPKSVTALEVWVFDKNDINTVTKVLRSAHGFYDPAARSSRDRVSDVQVIESDQALVLETKTLRLRVKVLAVDYLEDLASPQSFFKQVNLKLAVWQR